MKSNQEIEEEKENNKTTKGIEEEKNNVIVYSSYGYLNILENDLNNDLLNVYYFTQFKNDKSSKNLLKGSIYKNNIKFNINIKIKYFISKRQLIKYDNIDINTKINTLIEKLFINEDPKSLNKKYTKNSQYRLYSCKTALRELNTGQTFYENNIHDDETLLFFSEIPLAFSTTMRGKSIEISQQGKTAFKINTDDPQYVLGNIGYTGGRHYFEVKLMTEPMIRSIVVGLGIKKDEKNYFSNYMNKFYGYILSDMKKIEILFNDGNKENLLDYGEICSINDCIGVLYDCREDGVDICFYKNKKNLGIAYHKLPKDFIYFPAIEMGFCGSKIQIYNDIDFPEEK